MLLCQTKDSKIVLINSHEITPPLPLPERMTYNNVCKREKEGWKVTLGHFCVNWNEGQEEYDGCKIISNSSSYFYIHDNVSEHKEEMT